MRDLIWTIVVIWLVYKLVDIFRRSGSKNSGPYQQPVNHSENRHTADPEKVKNALRKSADSEGEYVDYKELS